MSLLDFTMLLIAVVAGIIVGCSATLLSVSKEMAFRGIDRTQNEIRLEMETIDMERLNLEGLLTALEAYGMEINGVLIRKDGQDFLKFVSTSD